MEIPLKPPKEWFDRPDEIPTDRRITITPEGRVYGYISLWDTCHAGLPGCVKPPQGSPSNYGYAHQGETETAEGELIATANIGGGAGHAPIEHGAPPEFYENTSTQLMRVRYGEDENGLWFSGALWPDVSDMDIAKIRASSISGDWRWMASYRASNGGEYDFAGACFVNIPGYPMASAGNVAMTEGEMQNIAASTARSERFALPSGVRESVAATAQDANGNIIALYATNETSEEESMSCNGNCACGKNVTAAADEKCPCGKMTAAECNCDGKNVTAAVEDEQHSEEAPVEQPKLPVESHNEVLAGMARGMEELSTRMSGIEELLAQIIAARTAEKLAE
jgi:hypothetical protein